MPNAVQNQLPAKFSAVVDFVSRMQPDIDLYTSESFGCFTLYPNIILNKDFPYIEYRTDDGLRVKLQLSSTVRNAHASSSKEEYQFSISSLDVLIDGKWWSVDPYNITCKTNLATELKTFPVHELRWVCDIKRLSEYENLEYFSYQLSEGQGVFYEIIGDEERRNVWPNNSDLAESFPETIKGLESFEGIELPWEIDVEQVEGGIINHSKIFEFLALIPFKL